MRDVTIPEGIPAEVWKYAEAVEKVWRDLPPREAIEHHARAILAERERCANIAAGMFDLRDGNQARVASHKIAQAIRSSHE